MNCLRLFPAILIPVLAAASEIPAPVLPSGVGVNIHFVMGHERDLDMIAAAGFKFVRMDFSWTGIERKPNEYDWSGYDRLMANLDQRGLRALFIFDYSNPLYEATVTSTNPISHQLHKTTASPQKPESVAAFARWAGAAAKHFQGRHVIWEIWNEPNIHFWSPNPDVGQYITLAMATCKAVRVADRNATIIGPATSGFPWRFLETFFESGILAHLDGVSVHPYRDYRQSPETAAADYQKLRGLIDRYAPPEKKGRLPILSGEWGYSTYTKGVSPETQAAFAVRQQLANLLHEVPLSIWYDWKNDGTNAADAEHNFGTVSNGLQLKPAYTAVQTLTRELAGYRLARRWETGDPQDYVLAFTNAIGVQRIVAWTASVPHSLSIAVPARTGTVNGVHSDGRRFTCKSASSNLSLDLASAPQYLDGIPVD